MAVISINKILGEVWAKYLPEAKVPSLVIAAEMQMFPIDQVITQGWPLLQAILKPGPEASALEIIATPVNPLLDPQPRPSLDPKDQIIKALEVWVASLEKQVERIPDLELQVSSLAQVIEALWEQVQSQLAAPSFPTSSHRSLHLPASVSRQMQRLHLKMANSHLQSAFLILEAEGQPSSHLGLQLVGPSTYGGKSAPSPLHLLMH
ncbi:hypothetical protein PAXRUDRAFT_15322 [Paxillus rubicundulus Ve08.2h10]|uniref:Uncharacterized protein n=1 Tax=Paxillus rubicundulus Ve08.2h10 TaxID=930991 RepID=A0A0D0DQ25_9AGAM|nr:hypothetical protein PAXRUDRAFT_15322 [Paxillus rubicundulus Ve08.2h10]